MLRFKELIILSIGFGLLIIASRMQPLWVTLPVGAVFALLMLGRRRVDYAAKMEHIQQRLSNLRGEGLIIEGAVKSTGSDFFYRLILTILTDLERSLFKLVEKNIQLLSLKEIGRNIVSSMDEQKLIDSVFEYLKRGVGYKETAFILLRKKNRCFQAIVDIERPDRLVRRALSFGFEDLKGAAYESFVSGRPYLIKDVEMHPLFDVGGEQLFPASTMTSYLCVPLVKSADEVNCGRNGDCLLVDTPPDGEPEKGEKLYLRNEECLACPDIPLLGALIVTDGYKASPLTNIDQVTIETVASLVGSNIENWYLYQELRQEELFRDNVIEGMINGVFAVDLEGNVTLANKSARIMGKLKENEALRLNADDLIVEEATDEPTESAVFRVLRENISLTFYEAHLKRKDGIHIPIRMNVSALRGEDGIVQGAIIEFVDLSEIKRMEEQIRHLDRLAVLGRFTSAVAHEVRNPLTGIAAGIQYINRDEKLSDEQRENISFVLNEVDRLNRIIADLFKVVKPSRLIYRKVNLGDLIARSFHTVKEIFDNREIDFGSHIEDNIPRIEIDPDQIQQVLINIIKNSAEAVENGGKVRVRVILYDGGDPEVVLEKDKNMVCIEIADNGGGIEQEDRERIFEPFFSRKKKGTGLGLFITHSIIQHHQGRISVSSNPEGGTIFRVYLPISRPAKGGES